MYLDVDYLSELPPNNKNTGLRAGLQDRFPYSVASLTPPLMRSPTIIARDIPYFLRQIAEFETGHNDLDQDIQQTAYMVLFTHVLRAGLAKHIGIEKHGDACSFTQAVKEAQRVSGLNRRGDFVGKSGKREETEKIQAGQILWDELMSARPFAETGHFLPKDVVLRILKISDPLFWTPWPARARAITYALDTYPQNVAELEKLSRIFGPDYTEQQRKDAEERDILARIERLRGPELAIFHRPHETWDQKLAQLKAEFKSVQTLGAAGDYRNAIVAHLLSRATSAFHLDRLREEFGYCASLADVITVARRVEERFSPPRPAY